MKTLVIHPEDRSTEFLKEIYIGKGWTINNDIYGSRKKVIKQIEKYDRIIMMGHGCPTGLFYTPIRGDLAYLLREKEGIYIWCHADQFVLQHGLTGFYTGMFLSEVSEANYFRIKTTQEQIDYSNNLFTQAVKKHIDSKDMFNQIVESYKGNDPVIRFNNERLYYRDGEIVLTDMKLLIN